MSTKHDEQMPERCAQVATRSSHWPCAVATRQVLVEKAPNCLFIDPADDKAAAGHPAHEVRNTTQVGANGVGRVAALGEVLRERVDVGCERALAKPFRRAAVKAACRIHRGLLKWVERHFRPPPKLCLDTR